MVAKKAIKKAVKTKSTSKALVVSKPFSKAEIIKTIAEMVNIEKKQATITLEALMQIIKAHVSKKGPGIFVLPGVAKFHVLRKAATKARKGNNPFTGEPMVFAAKPARNIVKIRPLKKLKDLVK